MKNKILRTLAALALAAIIVHEIRASTYPNWGQGMTGIADSSGEQYSDSHPFPMRTIAGSLLALTPGTSAAAEGNHVLKASAATYYGGSVTTGSVAGFLMLLNSATDPADGPVLPMKCVQAPANTTVGLSPDQGTTWTLGTGAVLAFSTTGCFTKTESATATFSWQVL